LQKNGGGVSEFIKHYDESMQKVCIENTSADGIRLLTIHKSKGLEFDNVIMPFCDWQHIREGESLIWSEPKEPPFSELAVIPLDYRKSGLLNTIYENHYWHEYLQYAVDNMNLLYVGMTRAKQNLYVITQSGQNDDRRGWLFGRIIENVAKDLQAEYIDNVMRFGTPPEDVVCENKLDKIKEELADVINYCILMADACGLDLDEIVQAKIMRNNEKYPGEKAYGNKEKYTELKG
jgi:ATP-dependent exoDNAse (exonuclease V) beta subunit